MVLPVCPSDGARDVLRRRDERVPRADDPIDARDRSVPTRGPRSPQHHRRRTRGRHQPNARRPIRERAEHLFDRAESTRSPDRRQPHAPVQIGSDDAAWIDRPTTGRIYPDGAVARAVARAQRQVYFHADRLGRHASCAHRTFRIARTSARRTAGGMSVISIQNLPGDFQSIEHHVVAGRACQLESAASPRARTDVTIPRASATTASSAQCRERRASDGRPHRVGQRASESEMPSPRWRVGSRGAFVAAILMA